MINSGLAIRNIAQTRDRVMPVFGNEALTLYWYVAVIVLVYCSQAQFGRERKYSNIRDLIG